MSSMSVDVSAFPPPTVSSDASTAGGSLYTSLSSVTPRPSMTMQTLSLDVTPLTYAGSASKSSVASVAFTTSEITKVSSSITPTSFSSPAEPTFPSGKTIPTTVMAGTVTPFIGIPVSPLLSSKNTEPISSIPKTTFSSFLSTAQQSSQRYQGTSLGIFPGITNSSLSTVSSGKVTALINTHSRTGAPESVLSSTLENLHTSLNIQISPSLTGFKSTPGSTKSVKITIYHSSNTEKKTSSSENTSTAELTKGAMSVNTPLSYPPWIPSGTTSPSSTLVLFSPQSTEAKFSTPKTSLPPMSQRVESPFLQTRTTSSNAQSLLLTSWNTPTAEDSEFSASTTAHVSTSHKKQTESPYVSLESLSTFPVSQTGLVLGDVMAMSSISTTGTLPTLGMSESPSLSISSKSIPITLADIKHTFEKTTTSVTPGTTLPSNISDAASESIISKAAASPMLTWILSSLPSGSPLATRSNTLHIISSSSEEIVSSLQFSCSVVSDSLQPHKSQHARPPCPSPTPGVHSNSCPSSQ
ncbi:adhesion G-protein coupled receptor G4-like [Bubalus kerabau]|uniref:adhesion G-protein coupled receptor G4-like n=1 Tax=Bubalus carabanensis TaxID=3119969 RepID=UPI00244E751C|nr:adhesion G-protein coupled receptor G4-like [Bubalus carabanensis]